MKKFERPLTFILGCILIVGGLYTFYSTSEALFGLFGREVSRVAIIPITQICSLACSFLYLISGLLFFRKSKFSTTLLFVATIIMFVGYVGMLLHISSNKPFNPNIIPEMLIRTTSTMLYAAAAWYFFSRVKLIYPKGYDAKSFKQLSREYEMKKKDYSNPQYP